MKRISVQFLLGILLLAFGAQASRAQQQVPAAVLTGTVVDDETGTPLAGAHVFIAESMIGTTTDAEGRYRLERVPMGAHRLYASIIGFEPLFRDIMLRESRNFTFDFRMQERVSELDGITVEAQGDKRWKKRLERFTRIFVGETPNSKQTKILNPEVLDFADKGGTLLAFASDIIQMENEALGYRIQYFLKDFKAEPSRIQYDGEPLYEEMTPDSPEQAAMWEENRRKAFYGSFRHFMLASLAGKAKEHGFETFQRSKPAGAAGRGTFEQGSGIKDQRVPFDINKILQDTDNPNEKLLDLEGAIELIFKGEIESKAYAEWQKTFGGPPGIRGERFQKSLFWQENGPTLVDYKGDILNPYGVTVSGHLAFERVADELPKEYRPSR